MNPVPRWRIAAAMLANFSRPTALGVQQPIENRVHTHPDRERTSASCHTR